MFFTLRSFALARPWSVRAAVRGAFATILMASLAGPLNAQSPTRPNLSRASRSELAARAADLERQLADSRQKSSSRASVMRELAALNERLRTGDFHVGDRLALRLRQDSIRFDSATVRDSLNVRISNLPDVSLAGVLRSELDEKLSTHVARYLRNASVTSTLYTRVAILGAVSRPGVYHVPTEQVVSDVVMLAGGPGLNADLGELEVRRGGAIVLTKKDSRRAIKEGRTLEQLDVQSGDEVNISAKRKINWQIITQLLLIASTLTFAVIQFLQYYYTQQEQ